MYELSVEIVSTYGTNQNLTPKLQWTLLLVNIKHQCNSSITSVPVPAKYKTCDQ